MGEKAGSIAFQAIVSLVVLRLLTPEDLGVMAIPTIITALSLVMVDSGFSQTLIRRRDPSPADYVSVFRFNLVVSVALYLLLLAVSPSIARFYGMPELAQIAPVLYLVLPVNALCVIQNTLLVRNFRFSLLSKIVFVSTLAGGLTAIGMALAGCGIWSLVGQRLVIMLSRAVLLWLLSDWRPRAAYDGDALRSMAPFSLRLLATDLITSLYNNAAQLFIGKIYAADTLGYFNQAQKLKDMPVTATVQSVQNVIYPSFSRLAAQPAKLAESYRQVMMMVAFGMFPLMAGAIGVAHEFFAFVLGERWMPIVPYFRIACLAGLFAPLAMVAFNILKVGSNGKVIVRLEIVKKVAMTLILALTIPRSVMAVAWGLVAVALLELLLNLFAARRYAALAAGALAGTLLPIALLAAVMYGAVMAVGELLDAGSALTLLVKVLTGMTVYAGLSALFRLEAFRESREIVRSFFRR